MESLRWRTGLPARFRWMASVSAQAEHPRPLLGDMPAGDLEVGLTVAWCQPGPLVQLLVLRNPATSPISATITAASTGPMPGSCWMTW